MALVERRELQKIYVCELGYFDLGRDDIIEISEHPVNSYINIVYKDVRPTMVIAPGFIIARIYK